MLKRLQREQVSSEALHMPDQNFQEAFRDELSPGLSLRTVPSLKRCLLLGLPLMFASIIAVILVVAFQNGGQVNAAETILIILMALLAGWEAIPSANAVMGRFAKQNRKLIRPTKNLSVAILTTIRDESAGAVVSGKLDLIQSLQNGSLHRFALHILSDSSSAAQVAEERRLVNTAVSLPVFHHHRRQNVDFKSGNIRNWISQHGAPYDAIIILDADSELGGGTALALANALADDPACGLIQTIPLVQPGNTRWQFMQSVASHCYGELQATGLSMWMGDEANYYGHNAIIRTKAFAACTGLPRLEGRGLWNGTILSHDFVEAALLRRAGWAVRLLPSTGGSFEQAPVDIVAHIKRDARWCLGNFQHSRIVSAVGLHTVSRFHLVGGILTYLSSVMWLATLGLWAMLDSTQTGIGGNLAAVAFALITANVMLPRVLGILHTITRKPFARCTILKAAISETIFSSLIAPSMMLQRVMIIGSVLANQKLSWAPMEKSNRNLLDYCVFHGLEMLLGLGLFASIERGYLTSWFLPLAICLSLTPFLSWYAAQPAAPSAHEKLNDATLL